MSPIVKSRVSKTMGYFGYGVGFSASVCFALRNSARAANIHWAVCLAGVLGCLIGTVATDYETQFPLKAAFYSAFCGMEGLMILPLIQMSTGLAIGQASMATGMTMASLATVAMLAPSEQFLNWGGALGLGCGALMGVSLASIFFPGSKVLFNIWLWGGLGLFSAFTLYDTQKILMKAKTQPQFDPISNALEIYMDAVNLFIRFLIIFGNRKK